MTITPTAAQEAAAEKLLEHARTHISYYVPAVLAIAALIAERDHFRDALQTIKDYPPHWNAELAVRIAADALSENEIQHE